MSTIVSDDVNYVDNHALKLFHDVASLFDVNNVNSLYSDVTVRVGHRTFYCHKLILQLKWENSTIWSRLSSNEFQIKTINPDTFNDVLQFIYTGEVLVSTNNIESLLSASRILCMVDLMQICVRFLENIIHKNPVRQISDNTHLKLNVIYQSHAIKSFDILKNYPSLLLSASEIFMKVILGADDLEVECEEEVCDILKSWLQIQTGSGNEVHPDRLLPLIRWNDVSLDYVTSELFPDNIFMSNPASVTFLSKVTTFLMSGVQFDGLNTFHRHSIGVSNSVMVIGLCNGYTRSSKVYGIDLECTDDVTIVATIPTTIHVGSVVKESAGCAFITGAGKNTYKKTWKLESDPLQITKCRNMLTDRQHHCAAVVNSKLYVLGGMDDNMVDDEESILSSVESYNIDLDIWSSAGHLIHAVYGSACATYNNNIYVFGGANSDKVPVNYVQVYDISQKCCTLMDQPIPRAWKYIKAVLWETSVILFGHDTCFIYNFETRTWQERKQFKTGVVLFEIVLDKTRVFISGGAAFEEDNDGEMILKSTDTFTKSVSVYDIIENKSAVWKYYSIN